MKRSEKKPMAEPKKRAPLPTALVILTLLLNAFFGAYNDLAGCVSAVLLSVAAGIIVLRARSFTVSRSIQAAGCACLSLGYLITCAYAVDRGYAFLGFVRFLPVLLMLILCMQMAPEDKTAVLNSVPAIGLAQTLFCVPAYFIPFLKERFFTYGRFHGGFGYSNTFALFLLAGILIILLGDFRLKKYLRLCIAAALLAGILISGSRTVFLLFLPAAVFVVVKRKELRIPLAAGAVAIIAAAAVYGVVSGNHKNIARFLEMSLAGSTLTDRLLYDYDALRLIPKHLFGLGCRGYQFLIPSEQTGYYSVTYTHCEYLQLILDIGLIPAAVFFIGFFKSFFARIPLLNKLLLGVFALHIAVDFDFQFLAVLLLVPLLLPLENETTLRFDRSRNSRLPAAAAAVCCAVFTALGCWLSAACGAEALNRYPAALKIYPGLTLSRVVEMRSGQDDAEAEKHAMYIIKNNGHVPVAYDFAARSRAENGDFDGALELKDKAIENAPLVISEYEDKFSLLYQAIWHADETGDRQALSRYCEAMLALPDDLMLAESRLSSLGRKIKDVPDLKLSDEASDYIDALRRSVNGG